MNKIKNPIFPMNRVIRRFMTQTLQQLEVNAMTQRVFPSEIYNGFAIVNQKRKEMAGGDHSKGWFADGEGAKSFRARLVKADETGNVTLVFSFNDYMRYVDMGVGGKTSLGDVDSSKKARYKTRYVGRWDRSEGKSQRPAIMMEMRHLQSRIRDYLVDYYGYQNEVMMVNAFGELPEIEML